ncbi:S8 family peptidase [Litorivicinus lipolyticus]|uniref:S8 family peptidase n=1 Tax=Litorivicinus lipolyticus TaxID=418701 RepID=UPI003B5AFF1C
MKNFKKTAVAAALTVCVSGAIILPNDVEAAVRDYSSLVEQHDGGFASQTELARQYIAQTERFVYFYDMYIDRYRERYSTQPWFGFLIQTRDDYQQELDQLTAFLDNANSVPAAPVLVRTETAVDTRYDVVRSAPYEVDRTDTVVEETDDGAIHIYAVVTRVMETAVKTTTVVETTTTRHYNDGSTEAETHSEVSAVETTYEQETQIARQLIESRDIAPEPAPEQEVVSGQGSPTLNVIAADAYMARDDVNLSQTQNYVDAFQTAYSFFGASTILSNDRYGKYGNDLDIVNAPEAWARGWTGAGSTIAILDTGIDADHSEFAGRILDQQCFTSACNGSEGMDDVNGHGTHVAGTAAAALDGIGMTGVAPDANLIIGKVATKSGFYDMMGMAQALGWASESGAAVANVSGGYSFGTPFRNAVTAGGNGTYSIANPGSDSTLNAWATNGYYNLNQDSAGSLLSTMKANFSDSEMVMVAAAGNQGLAYSAYPGNYATQTNSDGTLTFGGRILIAGSYDVKTDDLSSFSNAAGTLCVGDSCATSDYRVSDFYLMAPGSFVASAQSGGGYTVKSGTSMAAPVISGAVAIVHQMWPHMKGENLAQLLLATGNKNIPNYDENRHGQGLLDLDEATSPQGTLSIPTSGRADGATTNDFGAIGLSGGAQVSEVMSSLMVLDDYDRDFYVDASSMVTAVDTRTLSHTVAHKDLINTNAYAGYATDAQLVGGGNTLLGISDNGDEINLSYDFNNGLSLGYMTETGTFLGNTADSDLMRINGATTGYLGYNFDTRVSERVSVFGGASAGFTTLDIDQQSMLKGADTVISNTANIGARFNTTAGEFGVVAALPVAIASGDAHFRTPSDIDASGNLVYQDSRSNLAGASREYNLGVFYNNDIGAATRISAYAEQRSNYTGIDGKTEVEAGIQLNIRF